MFPVIVHPSIVSDPSCVMRIAPPFVSVKLPVNTQPVMVAAPPGTPNEVRKILSEAMQKAMQDPESTAWAKKTKRPFAPLDTEAATAYVAKATALYRKYKSSLQKQD